MRAVPKPCWKRRSPSPGSGQAGIRALYSTLMSTCAESPSVQLAGFFPSVGSWRCHRGSWSGSLCRRGRRPIPLTAIPLRAVSPQGAGTREQPTGQPSAARPLAPLPKATVQSGAEPSTGRSGRWRPGSPCTRALGTGCTRGQVTQVLCAGIIHVRWGQLAPLAVREAKVTPPMSTLGFPGRQR